MNIPYHRYGSNNFGGGGGGYINGNVGGGGGGGGGGGDPPLPQDWVTATDEQTGRTYFYHIPTKTSQWEKVLGEI